ncbi:hypothetical protein HPB49_012521 [Dermacentor silvarum]|uniref:Uncharacterized protein n=1 Tax=Dermacentor silvarum TaxID=543639 RepID=A0ACB8CFB2_DERSI|nr:hypothetical protein HPB49_012521 [Dermacentor silvarum]
MPSRCSSRVAGATAIDQNALCFLARSLTLTIKLGTTTCLICAHRVAVEKTWASSWLDNETKHFAAAKLTSVRTVVWPSDKFFAAKALEEVYENFTDTAASFVEYWIQTRRSQRLMFGTEAAEQELLLGDNTQLPYVEYVHLLNRLSVALGALAPPLYYRDGTNAMLHGGILYLYARELIKSIDNEGLEDLTEEKVFFITACLSSCAVTPADNLFGGDCNKAVMNFAPFAKAFGCPVGSNMNPATKCTFYD